MKIIGSLIAFWVTALLCTTTIAQTPYLTDKIIPPSPNAASLGKYGNNPVNFFSGQPTINIPIYNIKTPNHSLGISLSYSSGGIKVAEDASLVGLGWTLNAGGAITRIIRGIDDFNQHGYYFSQSLPPSNPDGTYAYDATNWPSHKTYCDDVFAGNMDSDPDIFSYNFNGHAGRFVLAKKADGGIAFMDDKNNLQIQYLDTIGTWRLIDADGVKYYFTTPEYTNDYSISNSFEFTTPNKLTGLNQNLNALSVASAWYLDSIEAPSKEKIYFSYVNGYSLSLLSKSEVFYQMESIALEGCSGQVPDALKNNYHGYTAARQEIRDVYLQKITFLNGTVEFNTSPRSDIEYISHAGYLTPSKLDNLVVKSTDGSIVKKFNLSYSYFNSADITGRLRLDSITTIGGDNTSLPPWKFDYNADGNLPDKNSKSIDDWGFYNAVSNSTLLPTTLMSGAYSFTGADRSPDTSGYYSTLGILQRVTYPTGGTTSYEYQLNDYSNLSSGQQYLLTDTTVDVHSNPGGDKLLANFSIPPIPGASDSTVSITIRCSYQKYDANVNDQPSLGYSSLARKNANGTQTSIGSCDMTNYDGSGGSPSEFTKNVQAGNFQMYVQSVPGFSTYMSVTFKAVNPAPVTKRKGGGLRISRIIDFNGNSNPMIRRYLYTDDNNLSTGTLSLAPTYLFHFGIGVNQHVIGTQYTSLCWYNGTYNSLSSSNIYPAGLSSKGAVVGYRKVTELLGDNGENGRTEYYFHATPDTLPILPSTPAAGDPLNGETDSIKIYNAAGKLLQGTYYTYQVRETDGIKGMKLFTAAPVTNADYVYDIRFYDNKSYWTVPISEQKISYDGAAPIINKTIYTYGNSIDRLPRVIDSYKSNGKILRTITRRVSDFSLADSGVIYSYSAALLNLQKGHLISPVIEQYTQVLNQDGSNVKAISANLVLYNANAPYPAYGLRTEWAQPDTSFTQTIFDPATMYRSSNYLFYHNYDQYDSSGHLLQEHLQNGENHSYLWDKNQGLLIASVVNAKQSEIAYTSFETGDAGAFTMSGTINNTGGMVGSHTFTGTLTFNSASSTKPTVVIVWAKQGSPAPTINGATFTRFTTRNGYDYYANNNGSQSTSWTITGTNIDEVRLHPADAFMKVYYTDPLRGLLSSGDEACRYNYFEYDGLGRLHITRDLDGSITKIINYQSYTSNQQ